ncbi:MAG: flagellar biosynthesis protein FlhF [Gammaproteobacteria bacterium]
MKIKRFTARTMRQALRQVREEQGPDAVILSNVSVDDGVEVVAAVDYDESLMQRAATEVNHFVETEAADTDQAPDVTNSQFTSFLEAASAFTPPPVTEPVAPAPAFELDLATDPTVVALRDEISGVRALLEQQLSALAWGEQTRNNPDRAKLLRRLTAIGLDSDVATLIADRTLEKYGAANASSELMNVLGGCLSVEPRELCDEGGIFAVVGPTGVGKTTTIAKLAARCALRHGRDSLALVSTDSFRIGAQEQLATFAQILDVPVHLARDAEELQTTLRALSSRRLVLIDTAGVGQRDSALEASLAVLEAEAITPRRLLAIPANVQREALNEIIERFSAAPLHGAIVTKVDEAASFGAIFSNLIRHQLPLTYLADGQRVPEDLHQASHKLNWWVNEAQSRVSDNVRDIDDVKMAQHFSEGLNHAYA